MQRENVLRLEPENLAPAWRRDEMRGHVCQRCGFHAYWQASREVHDRRAQRGLGCAEGAYSHTEPLHSLSSNST